MKGCNNSKVERSQTCQLHQERWHSHMTRYGRQSLLGIRRLLRRTEEENQEWLPPISRQAQPHDQPPVETQSKDNYFVAPRFYCVETVCAPCGVVIAWTKFDKLPKFLIGLKVYIQHQSCGQIISALTKLVLYCELQLLVPGGIVGEKQLVL